MHSEYRRKENVNICRMLQKMEKKIKGLQRRLHAIHETLEAKELKYIEYKIVLGKALQSVSEIGLLFTRGFYSVGEILVGCLGLILLVAIYLGYMKFIANVFLALTQSLDSSSSSSFLFLLKVVGKAMANTYSESMISLGFNSTFDIESGF